MAAAEAVAPARYNPIQKDHQHLLGSLVHTSILYAESNGCQYENPLSEMSIGEQKYTFSKIIVHKHNFILLNRIAQFSDRSKVEVNCTPETVS